MILKMVCRKGNAAHGHRVLRGSGAVGLAKSNVLRYFESREAVLLDLMAKRKSEIGVINGSIPRVGREVGVAAPVNETVTALVREKERRLGCR